jgi:hypothetical protein
MSEKKNTCSGPLLIRVSLGAGSSTYSLAPLSQDRVCEAFPGTHMLPTVSFGYRRPEEFKSLHGPLWLQAAQLLTGLTSEQLGRLGGLVFQNPRTKEVIWEWQPGTTKEGPATDSSCSDKSASRARSRSTRSA